MGNKHIRAQKGTHASQQLNVKSGPALLNTNTHQSPQMQHYRNLGNRAVQRMVESGVVQPKLQIDQPNDIYEQEADRVPDQLMRMHEPKQSLVNGDSSLVQRQSTCPECMKEEEIIQTRLLADEITPLVQRQVEEFEPSFGVDFSQGRIYTGKNTAESERMLNAKTYTLGRDVAFGTGQLQPETPAGKHLLAHELKHVVQQRGMLSKIQRACGIKAIGRPQGCTRRSPIFVPGAFFRFDRDCDDFASGQDNALLQYAATLAPTDVIEIHGYASVDGLAVFNHNLACARAIKARELLATRGGIQRTRLVGIFNHGPTPGPKADRRSVVIRSTAHTGPRALGFIVHSLNTRTGRLDDPAQDMPPGKVSWPLAIGLPGPLRARADVEVVGGTGDPCAQYQIGFLQTVFDQWLNIYYSGRQRAHGHTVIEYKVSLPIRDEERTFRGGGSSMWYSNNVPGRISPAACNMRVNPEMNDYPTIWWLPKVHRNTRHRAANYLTGVFRGMTFLTTLVASGPGGVIPLRHFQWFYMMDIDFTPNYAAVNQVWPFRWNVNKAYSTTVQNGADKNIPIFTTATPTYNQLLKPQIFER